MATTILVLGMDNTGKTTLVNNLFKHMRGLKLSGEIIKSPGPISSVEMINWVSEQVTKIRDSENDFFIFDRFCCFDEPVYGPIIRKTTPKFIEPMRKMIALVNPIIVYARPKTEDIISFSDGREQMEGVVENAKDLLMAYDYTVINAMRRFDVIHYDYNQDTVGELFSKICNLEVHRDSMEAALDITNDLLMNPGSPKTSLFIDIIKGEMIKKGMI